MKNIFITKFNSTFTAITFLSFFLATNVLAQEKFIEKNLPQTELKEASKTKSEDSKSPNLQYAKSAIKDSIDKIILRKKTASLMFDDEESLAIKTAVETYKSEPLDPELRAKKLEGDIANKNAGEKDGANEKFNIYLDSILYYDSRNWVIWVNNQKITSQNNKRDEEIFVKFVSKEKVKLVWQMSVTKWKILSGAPEDGETPPVNNDNKVEITVELKPNQTYVLNLQKVVEGKKYNKASKVEDKNVGAEKIVEKQE